MSGKYSFVAASVALMLVLIVSFASVDSASAVRVCSFKGTVIDHGWRSMTVKTGNRCSEVNVGWRTKYIPNRRPCIGERVAMDFLLEDGYMRATKVMSLSPLPPSRQCYPPPPPEGATCRNVVDETTVSDTCSPAKPTCSTKPPAHVSDREWSPDKKPSASGTEKPSGAKTSKDGKKVTSTRPSKVHPEEPAKKPQDKPQQPSEPDKRTDSLTGEVVASSPKSLSVRVADEGEGAEVVNVRVGLKTKFIPFRRPAVGEKVRIDFQKENGDKFGYTVQVVQ
jgi:hypothetical protein